MIDKQLELMRLQLIIKLGEKLYYNHRNELKNFQDFQNFNELFEQLKDIDIDISKNTDGYMITKNISKCPDCQNDIDREDKFCNNCGFNILDYVAKYDLQCENCKSFILLSNKYCSFCGFKINNEAD